MEKHYLILEYTNKTKQIQDLNVRLDMIQCLEENMGRTLFDINYSNIFLAFFPKIMEIKNKLKNWDLIKLKPFSQQRKP